MHLCANLADGDEDFIAILEHLYQPLSVFRLFGVRGGTERHCHNLAQREPRHLVILVDMCDDKSVRGKNELGMFVKVKLMVRAWSTGDKHNS